jgi:hypothetical protein
MATGTQLCKGGLGSIGALTVFHSGEAAPPTATTGTDTTPVITETYVSRVFVPVNAVLTGVAVLNGSAAAGNLKAILYNADGVPVAESASTAQSGTAAYQQIPFAAAYQAQGPGRYFVGIQCSSTSARIRTHALGNFIAFKKTGETYGTATTLTVPATFTTGVGPIASTY